MCGRYALNATATELIEHFQLLSCPDFSPRFNIAPTSIIPIIRWKPEAGRVGQLARWGLIPSWSKEPTAKLNNARSETVHEKPSFRTSFQKHRCIIPASGFYEWQTVASRMQPYYIHPAEGFFAFAGLLAAWPAPDGQAVVSTCIITTGPNAVIAPIHDRMPVILDADQYDAWLDPENHDLEPLKQFLRPSSADGMVAYQVSPAINNGRIEGASCIADINK